MTKIKILAPLGLFLMFGIISGNSLWALDDEQEIKLIKMCDDGNSTACFTTGERFRVIERDKKTALVYHLKGCDKGHMNSCNVAGTLTQNQGKQYSKQWKEAAKLFQKACDAGEDQACFNIGALKYKEGRASAAKRYFKKACDMKNMVACNNLKRLNK